MKTKTLYHVKVNQHETFGVLVAKDHDRTLWLLCMPCDDCPAKATKNMLNCFNVGGRFYLYTGLNDGNLIDTKDFNVMETLGTIDESVMNGIAHDIIDSIVSYKINRFVPKEPSLENRFWRNFNMPVGMKVIGGRGRL